MKKFLQIILISTIIFSCGNNESLTIALKEYICKEKSSYYTDYLVKNVPNRKKLFEDVFSQKNYVLVRDASLLKFPQYIIWTNNGGEVKNTYGINIGFDSTNLVPTITLSKRDFKMINETVKDFDNKLIFHDSNLDPKNYADGSRYYLFTVGKFHNEKTMICEENNTKDNTLMNLWHDLRNSATSQNNWEKNNYQYLE